MTAWFGEERYKELLNLWKASKKGPNKLNQIHPTSKNIKSMSIMKTFLCLISLSCIPINPLNIKKKKETSIDLAVPKIHILQDIVDTSKNIGISLENVDVDMDTTLEECGQSQPNFTHKTPEEKSLTISGKR